VVQKGKAEIFSFDGSLLHDRPPLCLFGKLPDGRELTVMTVHMRSLGGITGSNGTRVRLKRQTQATSVSLMVNDLQTAHPDINLVVTGDFNAFQFTDGYAHVLGQIIGVPATASEAQLPGTDEVDPDLTNEILALAAAEQYSFIFDGNAQVLDHMLTSQALHPGVTGVQYARGNADAPRILVDDPSTALRASDHDGLVLYIASVAKENINALIEPKTRFVLFNFVTNQFSFQLAIANNSNQPIYAPICVKISDINPPPPTITIDNADNQQTGVGAVFNYSGLLGGDGKLDPGERSGFKTWRFNDPSQVNFSFFANVFGVLSNNTSGPSRLAGIANPAAQPLVFAADIRSGKLTMFSSLSEFEATQVPEEFVLLQNYPNPFNPETIITYHLAADAKVRLTIYNLAGQEITRLVDDEKEAGKYDVIWNGTDKAGKQVASGVYVYRIAAGNFKAVRKLTLLR
ncbi:T9SS type A sorting domain-containing protein, partial [candidate division KSB1 bacterium]|nr:T9SS type A sorting domain-containing protein [candidate division KSB1 bacterium]